MTGDFDHRQLPCSSPRGDAGAGIRTAELDGLPRRCRVPSRAFYTRSSGAAADDNRTARPGIPSNSMPVHKGTMLGPFDWCTVIGIGIAAGIVGIVLLIGW